MNTDATTSLRMSRGDLTEVPQVIVEKLARLDQISNEVLSNLPYIQDVHGQRRFSSFPVEAIVHYLHALWICDCKDMLLSVRTNLGRRKKGTNDRYERYEGQHALELLLQWQEGQSADVISFLELKLDYAPFSDITRNLEAATARGDYTQVRRLSHGRTILLNRTFNLACALRSIFTLPPERLISEVRTSCALYGHTIGQCTSQLAEMESPLYAFVPHPALARRNILLMNALGLKITDNAADRPGQRTARVQQPVLSGRAYADHVVIKETTML